jgi:hypothetical protein
MGNGRTLEEAMAALGLLGIDRRSIKWLPVIRPR